jgi:hypothetical protein
MKSKIINPKVLQPDSSQPLLLKAFLEITAPWREVFAQQRTFARALRQAIGGLVCLGRRTLTRILWTNGKEQQPWAADYLLHSRAKWSEQSLFEDILKQALPFCSGRVVGVAMDDTRLHKTGRCIKQAFYQRDPLSPAFHVNLIYGLRFLQSSLLIACHRKSARFGARALPIAFEEVSRIKRPGKKASNEELIQWKEATKKHNLSQRAVEMMRRLRQSLDAVGAQLKTLVIAGDGSFCNRTCFGAIIKGVELLVRARKNAKLCFGATPEEGKRRFYAKAKFTPESVRKDPSIAQHTIRLAYGGKRRKIRYKEIFNVFWQGGARRRPLRLITLAPTAYRKRKSGRYYYRQPAYLLTTDLKTAASKLIQIYLDRWQIEVNHREEKDTLGIGQAQLWNPVSVPRQPVLAVAAYSALLLAGIKAFGYARSSSFAALPAWRRHARRPSALDLVTRLRKEAFQNPNLLAPFDLNFNSDQTVAAAAA